MLKKILATALAAAMIFGLASVALAASPFPDTEGVTNEDAIARLKALKIFLGDDQGLYRPADPISRAEFTAAVVRMLGLETAAGFLSYPTVFPDVSAAHEWAYGYINIATSRGLIAGYPDGTFGPANNVTGAEALTILLRAAGYTDDLPGVWPINYLVEGATLGVIQTGFSPNVAATRNQVAGLVDNALDTAVVERVTDAAGNYLRHQAILAGSTVYENSFGVPVGVSKDTGKVTAYDTSKKTITLDDITTIDYVDGVIISGKDTIAALEGQLVEVTLNKSGDIVHIAVTTPKEIVGDITAVDTVNLKATIGGVQYTFLSDAEVYKNGELETTTTAGALVAIKDASAVLLLDKNGKVYRAYASITDKSSDITGKTSEIGSDGKLATYITTTAGGPYKVTADTTVVRNGASATYADLTIGDDVKYALKGTTVVYIDAFKNVVKGYTVTNYVSDASGATISVKKDGVESTFAVAKKSDGSLYVTLVPVIVPVPPSTDEGGLGTTGGWLGDDYDLTLNKDGKVTAVSLTAAVGAVADKVKVVASKDQVKNTAGAYEYRLNFTDGSSVNLNALITAGDCTAAARNGVAVAAVAADIWNAAKADDMYWLDSTKALSLYASSVSGRIVHAAGTPNYTLVNSSGVTVATFVSGFTTATKENGVAVAHNSLAAQAAPGIATFTGTVKFESSDEGVEPVPVSFVAEEFVAGVDALPIKGMSSDGKEYTYTLDNGDGTTTDVVVNIKSGIVMKGGEKIAPADVNIGDKLLAATAVAGVTPYVKAAADTTAPKVNAGSTATWVAGTTTLTVQFTTDEPVRKAYVWVGGVQKEAAYDAVNSRWELVTTEFTTKPGVVTIAVTDYAGNVSTGVDVPVS